MRAKFATLTVLIVGIHAPGARGNGLPTPNLLHDSEFSSNSAALNPWLANPDSPWTPGVWNAEVASLIVGSAGAISPHASNGMIRVGRTTLLISQVSQIVDVSAYATAIDAGGVYAKFGIWVNAPTAGVESAILLRNLPSPLRSSFETRRRLDPILGPEKYAEHTSSMTGVWQLIEGTHPLEPNTRYLHFEFYTVNATMTTAGVYFDSASVALVPEPGAAAILICGIVVIPGLRGQLA